MQLNYDSWEKDAATAFALKAQAPAAEPIVVLEPTPPVTINGLPSPPDSPNTDEPPEPPKENEAVPLTVEPTTTTTPEHHSDHHETPSTAPSSPTASSSGSPSQANKSLPRTNNVRKASTFRHVPRTSRALVTPSLLGPQHSRTGSAAAAVPSSLRHSMPLTDNTYVASRHLSSDSSSRITPSPAPLPPSKDNKPTPDTKLTTITNGTINGSGSTSVSSHVSPSLSPSPQAVTPPTRTISLHPSPSVSPAPRPSSSASIRLAPSRSSTSTPTPPLATLTTRSIAPYRPGFQPRGLYRPRTDEFLALRKISRDGVEESGMQKRIERTKLERRLEKLITLHFPVGGHSATDRGKHLRPEGSRRASSLFDLELGDLKRMSLSDATGLWKGVLSSGGGQNDIRGMISPCHTLRYHQY